MLRKIQELVVEHNSVADDKIKLDLGVKLGCIYVESNKHYDFFYLDNELEECYKLVSTIINEYKEDFNEQN